VESKNGAQLQFLASLDFTVLVFAVPLYPEWRSEEPGYHSFGIEHGRLEKPALWWLFITQQELARSLFLGPDVSFVNRNIGKKPGRYQPLIGQRRG
jgi:hypothetical protein